MNNYLLLVLIVFILLIVYVRFNYIVLTAHTIYDLFHTFITKSQNQIIKNLWIGDHYSSLNNKFIIDNNIKLIINCSKNLKFTNLNLKKYRIPIEDNRSEYSNDIMLKYFHKYYPIVDKYLDDNLGVLIHCHAGSQRSATFICLYLMKKFSYTFEEARNIIRDKRYLALFPNINFYKILTN